MRTCSPLGIKFGLFKVFMSDNIYTCIFLTEHNAPITWPPRVPDLNAVDFYLLGHAKSPAYAAPVDTNYQHRTLTVEMFNMI